jgi:NADH-quinone oxidoreductase subunit G
MPRLIIDHQPIEVSRGTKVIDAAERLGIMIPRFCYHSALGAVGACRLCAVKFVDGPVQGIEMSCMTEAQDEMVVSTDDPEALDFRRFIIECLMLNHPHDCPVCDEGGHCLLQDETVSAGHGIRRYQGTKWTYPDQYLGPFVQHEMNRCIHCYLCVRFYQQFAGYRDLGAFQIAHKVYYGRFAPGRLESPFSGNLIDICPTGVYTDKVARYRARRWDLERGASICIHCSLGCHTIPNARYREVLRLEAGYSEVVNGHFICDRGRFGFGYANRPDRPRAALIAHQASTWKAAVRSAAEQLQAAVHKNGAATIAALGSARSSLESQAALVLLARAAGWPNPVYFADPVEAGCCHAAVRQLDPGLAVSMSEVQQADWIIAIGADPVNEAPMLALAMRQAVRNGCHVGVIDPRPITLPFDFAHLPVSRERMAPCLNLLIQAAAAVSDPEEHSPDPSQLADPVSKAFCRLVESLKKSRRPVLVCGTDIVSLSLPAQVAAHARGLRQSKQACGLFYILPGPNAVGAVMMEGARTAFSFHEIVAAIEEGRVSVLIVVENDPLNTYPDRQRLEKALDRLALLIVLDYLPSQTALRADLLLPTTTVFESGSSFINQHGRIQYAEQIHAAGSPLRQLHPQPHPPRQHRDIVPGADPRPAWRALADIGHAMDLAHPQWTASGPGDWLTGHGSPFAQLHAIGYPPQEGPVLPVGNEASPFEALDLPESEPAQAHEIEILFVEQTFGTEILSCFSEPIRQAAPAPVACIHPDDALKLGLSEGDRVRFALEGGTVAATVALAANMAPGAVVIPRRPDVPWWNAKSCSVRIGSDRISKAGREGR